MPGPRSNLAIPLLDRPLFFERGEGARLFDVDGKDYIDFWNGAGPGFLGYGNQEWLGAVKEQLERLAYLPSLAQIEAELDLARKVVQHFPCAEKVRFVTTGTEAVQLAIRLGRAFTGRRYLLRFEGNFHGWLDDVLGGRAQDSDPPHPEIFEGDALGTEGRAAHALHDVLMVPWNDAEALAAVLDRYGNETAIALMEPILCNGGCCPPREGYLQAVRELCTRHGVVLCFDEVITGFRVGLGGAQGLYGVTPDLCTLGKALAGGLPMAAVAGKAEILDLLLERKVLGAGTFNGNPVCVGGALKALETLERDGGAFYDGVGRRQERLASGLRELADRRGIPSITQGPRGVLFFNFSDQDVLYTREDVQSSIDLPRFQQLTSHLLDEGVLFWRDGRFYICGALTDADVDEALTRADRALAKL